MKIAHICFLITLSLISSTAYASESSISPGTLNSAGEGGAIYGSFALMYDECVKEDFIKSDGPNAQDTLQQYITKIRNTRDDVTRDESSANKLADAVQLGFDTVKSKFDTVFKASKDSCARAEAGWPRVAKQLAVE
jgi:hypothetical protein